MVKKKQVSVKESNRLYNRIHSTQSSRRAEGFYALAILLCAFVLCLTPCTVLAAGMNVSVSGQIASVPGKVAGSGYENRYTRDKNTSKTKDRVIKAKSLDEYIDLTEADLGDAQFNVNKSTGRITGSSQKKTFKKTFGKPFHEVGGSEQELTDAINNTDGYEVSGETKKTIHVTSEYGLKRILVTGRPDNTCGALSAVYYEGETLLTFDSEESTRAAYDALVQQLGQERVFLDVPMTITETVDEPVEEPVDEMVDGIAPDTTDVTVAEEVSDAADEAPAEMYGADAAASVVPQKMDELAQDEEKMPHGWGTSWMNLDYAMEQFSDSDQSVTIAVLDSGINPGHEIFDGTSISQESRSFVDAEEFNVDGSGHATKVCGVIAESTGPNVSLLVLKVMNAKGEASTVSVFQAMEYAAQNGADIINLSMGQYYNEVSRANIDEHMASAAAKNVLICAASGNSGKDMDGSNNESGPDGKLFYPAASPYTVAVGAAGLNEDELFRGKFSNYGDALDFSAPGVQLELAEYDLSSGESGYRVTNGTSFATPYVCACAAFLKLNDDNNTADTIREQLVQISDDIGDPGWDRLFGYGIPNFINDSNLTPVELEGKPVVIVDTKRFAYDGTPKYPTVTVKYNGRVLTSYDLAYPTDTPDIGTHKVVVTLQGNYADSFVTTKKYQIIPKSVAVKDFATVTAGGTKAKFSWTKSQGTYQIMISTKKTFSPAKKYSTSETSKTISGLKPGQKYYVKVRAVKKVNGKNYYSFWSEVRGPYKW